MHQTVYASSKTLLRKHDGQELKKEGTEKVRGLVSRVLGYRRFP
jgi:hypothetical protein